MSDICRRVCKRAEEVGFVDPLTNLPPRDELGLSFLLSLYHQSGRVAWEAVPLLLPLGEASGRSAGAIFGRQGYLCSEYPLFWRTRDELEARGGMKPDFLFLSVDRRLAALVEHKIGSGETHKGDTYGGQFGRYLKYLVDADVPEAYLLLLTSQEFVFRTSPWYIRELAAAHALQCPSGQAEVFVMTWEAIFDAIRT